MIQSFLTITDTFHTEVVMCLLSFRQMWFFLYLFQHSSLKLTCYITLLTGLHNKTITGAEGEKKSHLHLLTLTHFIAALKDERLRFGNGYDQVEDVIAVDPPVRLSSISSEYSRSYLLSWLDCLNSRRHKSHQLKHPHASTEKCPSGWHHYEKTASCYKVYLRNENYWQAVDTCQRVNGSLATFVTNEELQFILKIEVDFDDKVCERKDQCKWVIEPETRDQRSKQVNRKSSDANPV